uniref:Xylanolytic transcriptional activator regulatory domain-containing protein n=1 Tax=Fusarium oxysporum (strain Fo5176) TaxID=660025 RepID=A0A0D2Y9T2_FUSOF
MPGVPLDTENLSNIADRLDAEHQSLNPASDGPRDLEGLGDNLEALEIDDEAFFFKFAESYLFFIEESWVFEKLDLLYKGPQGLSQAGSEVTVSILLTVLAIGTQYAHLEHTNGSENTSTSGLLEEEIGAMFYQQAIRLLPEIIEISSLESVQACLLFGYYSLPIDASGLGFIYRYRNSKSRLVDDLRAGKLMDFLEDMYHEINILRNCRKREIVTIVSRLVSKKDGLTTWWQSLPPDKIDANEQPTMTQSRSAMHLRLDYCLVRMFVGRPFLLKKETKDSATSPSVPENSPGTNERSASKLVSSREELISDCIKAATEALDICQQLRSSGMGLARASYSEYIVM